MSNQPPYIRYGPEWKNAMQRLSKNDLIEWVARGEIERGHLKDLNAELLQTAQICASLYDSVRNNEKFSDQERAMFLQVKGRVLRIIKKSEV